MNSDRLNMTHGIVTTAAADRKRFVQKLQSGKFRAAKEKVNIQLRLSHTGTSLTFAFHAMHP